jgi:predicted N-acetyltransferase YhbS
METTLIDVFDKTYELCDQIQYRDHERAAYEEICAEVFPGLSFEKWYKAGYWDGNLFNPHVLKDGDRIVSAVSVNQMNIKTEKEPSRLYIQLGGVMTSKNYRHQGLSTALMDKILTDWEDKCDGIYLFGHEGVRDFYPRFGFKIVDEYQYYMSLKSDDYAEKAVRLDMGKKEDTDKLLKYYKLGNPFSLLQIDNKGLLMFYCMKYNKNDIYYVEEEDAVVIAGHEKESMVVYDIFCKPESDLENILQAVADDNTQRIYFGFPLIKTKHSKVAKYDEEDNILFILDKKGSEKLSDFLHIPGYENKIMFPLMTHA